MKDCLNKLSNTEKVWDDWRDIAHIFGDGTGKCIIHAVKNNMKIGYNKHISSLFL